MTEQIEINWTSVAEGTRLRDLKKRNGTDEVPVLASGLLIKADDGGVLLIGDVNNLGGVCDDCDINNLIVQAYSEHFVPLMKILQLANAKIAEEQGLSYDHGPGPS